MIKHTKSAMIQQHLLQWIIQMYALYCVPLNCGHLLEKLEYTVLLQEKNFTDQIRECELRGLEPADLRIHFTQSMLHQFVPYYENSNTSIQMSKWFFIGLRRPVSAVKYPDGATNFTWYNGDLEMGDIFTDYPYVSLNGDNSQYCVAIVHTKSHDWYLSIQRCFKFRPVICQSETGIQCPFDMYENFHLNPPNMSVTTLSGVGNTRVCQQLCDDLEVNCWSFAFDTSSNVCQLFFSNLMPHEGEFCDWLRAEPSWTTFRRVCAELSIFAGDGSLLNLPQCPFQPTNILSANTSPSAVTDDTVDVTESANDGTRTSTSATQTATSDNTNYTTLPIHSKTDTTLSFHTTDTTFSMYKVEMTTTSNAKDKALFDKTGHTTISDNTGHTTISDNTGHTTVSDNTVHTTVSDNTLRTTVSDNTGHTTISDNTGHTTISDNTVHTTVSDNTVHTTVSDKTVRTTVSDNTVHTTVSDNTVRTTVSDNTVHTTVSDNTVHTTVSDNTEHTTVSDNTGFLSLLSENTANSTNFEIKSPATEPSHFPDQTLTVTKTEPTLTSTTSTKFRSVKVIEKWRSTLHVSAPTENTTLNPTNRGSTTRKYYIKYRKSCCPCSVKQNGNYSDIFHGLDLDKQNLSSYRRKYVSSEDNRVSAVCLGFCGASVLMLSTLSVAFMDRAVLFGGLVALSRALALLPGVRTSNYKMKRRSIISR